MGNNQYTAINNKKENRNLLTLISGNIIAQLIPFAFSPILSRYYSPEQFGELALLMGITNPISIIMCLRYDAAIVIPQKDSHARDLMRKSLFISLFISIIVAIICSFLLYFFNESEIVQKTGKILPFVAPVLFSIGISTAIGFMLQRLKQFKNIVWLKIVQMGSITAFNLIFALMFIENGLSLGYWLGWMISAIVAFLLVIYFLKINPFKIEHKNESYLKDYKHFPIYNGIPEFLNTLAISIPVFIFIHQFGEKETGYLNLCRQVLYFPASFISVALSQYYFQKFSEHYREQKKLMPVIQKIGFLTIPVSLAMIITIFFLGPLLFSFVFGEEWLIAGQMAQVLCFLFALQLCVVPLQTLFTATGFNKLFGLFKLLSFALNLALLIPVYDSPEQFLWIYTAVEGSVWVIGLITVFYIGKKIDEAFQYAK